MANVLRFNRFIGESTEYHKEFIKDCGTDLEDIGFTIRTNTSGDVVYGFLGEKYSDVEVIDAYKHFISNLKVEFNIGNHEIKFEKNKVTINISLMEKDMDGPEIVSISLDDTIKQFKIVKIHRDMSSLRDISKKGSRPKCYLSNIRFFLKDANNSESWIDFIVDEEDFSKNITEFGRVFVNPKVKLHIDGFVSRINFNSWFEGNIKIDKDSGSKFYNYFKERGAGWRYGTTSAWAEKEDLTEQTDPKDFTGSWDVS